MQIGSRLVEDMLAAGYGVIQDRRVAFRGRLEHLRKHDCPSGVRTGKGTAAVYGWPQVIELALALDLMNLGITPEHASRGVKAAHVELTTAIHELCTGPEALDAILTAVRQERWVLDTTIFLAVNIAALSSLKSDGSFDTPLVERVDGASLSDHLDQSNWYLSSVALINLGTRIAYLVHLVSFWLITEADVVVKDLSEWAERANSDLASEMLEELENKNVDS